MQPAKLAKTQNKAGTPKQRQSRGKEPVFCIRPAQCHRGEQLLGAATSAGCNFRQHGRVEGEKECMWKQRVWLKPKKQKSEHPEVKGSTHTLCFWKGPLMLLKIAFFRTKNAIFRSFKQPLSGNSLAHPQPIKKPTLQTPPEATVWPRVKTQRTKACPPRPPNHRSSTRNQFSNKGLNRFLLVCFAVASQQQTLSTAVACGRLSEHCRLQCDVKSMSRLDPCGI